MAKNKGWWYFKIVGNRFEDLSDADFEHIAKCIKDGFTSGEIAVDEN